MRAKSLPRENSYTVRNLRGRIYNSPPLLKIRPPYKKIAPPIKNSPLSQCTCFEVGDYYHVEYGIFFIRDSVYKSIENEIQTHK